MRKIFVVEMLLCLLLIIPSVAVSQALSTESEISLKKFM